MIESVGSYDRGGGTGGARPSVGRVGTDGRLTSGCSGSSAITACSAWPTAGGVGAQISAKTHLWIADVITGPPVAPGAASTEPSVAGIGQPTSIRSPSPPLRNWQSAAPSSGWVRSSSSTMATSTRIPNDSPLTDPAIDAIVFKRLLDYYDTHDATLQSSRL